MPATTRFQDPLALFAQQELTLQSMPALARNVQLDSSHQQVLTSVQTALQEKALLQDQVHASTVL